VVGDVVQDFSCSYQRQSGRLYVSTIGLFFYSNLFGYEKKVRIDYTQTSNISKMRTTSLLVQSSMNGDEYIFRSFDDRGFVLDIILRCHTNNNITDGNGNSGSSSSSSDKNDGGGRSTMMDSGGGGAIPVKDACSSEEVTQPVAAAVDKSYDKTVRRRRDSLAGCDASSPEPDVLGNKPQLNHYSHHPTDQNDKSTHPENARDTKKTNRHLPRGVESVAALPSNSTEESNAIMQLEKMKQQHDKGWEIAVSNLEVSTFESAVDFFDTFLCDDAPHSLKSFHEDFMKEKNEMYINAWKEQSDGDGTEGEGGGGTLSNNANNANKSLSRTIRFEHKTGAKVTRQQTYRAHGRHHACLKNVTLIKGRGIPDAFFVEDAWFVEMNNNGNNQNGNNVVVLVLNVKYRVNFTKSTMLRSIIEGRTKAETKEWYQSYSSFVRRRAADHVEGVVPMTQEESIAPAAATVVAAEDDGGTIDEGRPASWWDWFEILASSVREYATDSSTTCTPASFIKEMIQRKNPTREELMRIAADWYRLFVSLAKKIRLSSTPDREEIVRTVVDWYRFFVTSAPQYVKDLSSVSENAHKTFFLFLVAAIIIYRLKLRIVELEQLAVEFERRLLELEKSF